MHHILYMSTATILVTEEDLQQMLRQYRRNNQRDLITGLLLYSGEYYIQLIEGVAEALQQLFAKIQKDPLHQNIIKLADGEIDQRLFSDWSMGFQVVSKAAFSGLQGYINPVQPDFLSSGSQLKEESPLAVLQQFAQNNMTSISY